MASQREIARIAGVTQTSICKWSKSSGISLDDESVRLLFACIAELSRFSIPGNEAADIITQYRDEIRYLVGKDDRVAYVILFRSGRSKAVQVQPALSLRAVEALLESVPAAQVIALHHLVRRAADRLASLDRKEAA